MSLSVGEIRINLSAGTSQFVQDLEKAKGKITEFGGHATSEHKAAAAAGKLLEGQMFNNTRAMDSFLVSTLKLGPIVQAAFPVLGAVAFAGVLVETGKKIYEFFKNAEEAPKKMDAAFKAFGLSSKTSLDELHVSNDKLQQDIDKLQGKHTNNLALALDEARVMMDRLAESSDNTYEKLKKVLMENNSKWYQIRTPSNDSVQKDAEEFHGKIAGTKEKYGAQLDKLKPGSDAYKAIEDQARAELDKLHNDELKAQTTKRDLSQLAANASPGTNYKPLLASQNANLNSIRTERDSDASTFTHAKLETKKNDLETGKAKREADQKALKESYDKSLALVEASETLMASEKLAFRADELKAVSAYGDRYKELVEELTLEVGHLTQEALAEAKTLRDKDEHEEKAYQEKLAANKLEWAKRGYEALKSQSKSLENADLDLKGNKLPDILNQKPIDRLQGTPMGDSLLVNKQYPTINNQLSSISEDQNALAALQRLNAPLSQQLDLREKILEAQIALGQEQGQNTSHQQTQLAGIKTQGTLNQWNQINPGEIVGQMQQALMQVPQMLGTTLADAIFNHRKGDSTGKQLGEMFRNMGKQLLGTVFTDLIEKLAAEIAVHLFGIQVQSAAVVATNANTAALIANTAAQGVSGGASAAGGIASGVGSAASAAGSAASATSSLATGLAGPLISAAGGVIGGVISGVMSLIGDNRIVKAVNGTTAAVQALGAKLGNSTTTTNANGTTTTTGTTTTSTGGSSNGLIGSALGYATGLPVIGNIFSSIFGGGTKAMPVYIDSINPAALVKGVFSMFGFADGTDSVPTDRPSIIGEKGKEIFWPRAAGAIIPNHQIAAYMSRDLPGGTIPSAYGLSTSAHYAAVPVPSSSSHSFTEGSHTFHIHGVNDPRAIAKTVSAHLKNSSPKYSPFSH